MRLFKLYCCGVLVALLGACCNNQNVESAEFSKSMYLLSATAWYQQSAEMRACYYQSYKMAEMALVCNLQNKKTDKPAAVVLDIDETVIDNSPFEAKLIADNQQYTDSAWMAWSERTEARALPGAVEFINFARTKGVEVFLISNRIDTERQNTIKNLADVGVIIDSAHLMTKQVDKGSCKDERRSIVEQTHEIILLVGDNLGDYSSVFDKRSESLAIDLVDSLRDDFGTKFIVLPNPMYGEWENAIYKHNYKATNKEKNKMMLDLLNK